MQSAATPGLAADTKRPSLDAQCLRGVSRITGHGIATVLFASDKPLFVMHNKFTHEWHRPPVNFFSSAALDRIFSGSVPHFTIVYTRPGIKAKRAGFSDDEQADLGLQDLAARSPSSSVLLFEDIAAAMAEELSYNELKLMLYASSYFHLTVQGGNAHLAALFSGSLMAILHRFGQEILIPTPPGISSMPPIPGPTICFAGPARN